MTAAPARDDGRRFAGNGGGGTLPISNTHPVLRPLKVSETIARDLVHDIVERRLGPGAPLPHEAAMLELYGVSRESLREALRLLEVQGLITIRRGPGGGPSVGEVAAANLGRTASLYYHLAGATYVELLDAWVLVESTLAELAARQPDRTWVRDAMRPFMIEDQPEGDEQLRELVHALQFHAVVASLADNRVLELLLSTTGQIVTHQFLGVADPREVHDAVEHDHVAIARAVVAGHARKARDLMATHIREMADFCLTRLGPRAGEFVEWR